MEAIALPLALAGLTTKWKLGCSFYLACLAGTAFTDISMLFTGVMKTWPTVINSNFSQAPALLQSAAEQVLHVKPLISMFSIATLIVLAANSLRKKASISSPNQNAWLVASAALSTTLWIDGIFLLTALVQPTLSGLI